MGMKDSSERLKIIFQNLPNDPLVIELIILVREFIEENQQLRLENQQLHLENQQLKYEVQNLKDEIAILKNQPPRPKIEPSKLEKAKESTGNRKENWSKGSKNQKLIIDREEKIEIPPDQIPRGAIFKGYKSHTVQELIIRTETTRYLLAQWQLPDKTYIFAKLPAELEGQHFGPKLRTYILHQHHANRVTQNRIYDDLKDKNGNYSGCSLIFQ